jgi:hypothetical protein
MATLILIAAVKSTAAQQNENFNKDNRRCNFIITELTKFQSDEQTRSTFTNQNNNRYHNFIIAESFVV